MNRRTIIAASLAILLPVAATLLLAPGALFEDARPLLRHQALWETWDAVIGAVVRPVERGWESVTAKLDKVLTQVERERARAAEESSPVLRYERQIRGARLVWRLAVVLCLLAVLRLHYRHRGHTPRARRLLLHQEWQGHAEALRHRASSVGRPTGKA